MKLFEQVRFKLRADNLNNKTIALKINLSAVQTAFLLLPGQCNSRLLPVSDSGLHPWRFTKAEGGVCLRSFLRLWYFLNSKKNNKGVALHLDFGNDFQFLSINTGFDLTVLARH